jgi:acyl-CoA synthetase (AMP-forming)/AMP-acid ligase II/carbonic anhydrase/acetyltransferase-like protein (isoleucine patch superfamily)
MLELATLVSRHARYRPDKTAVIFEDQRLTWYQFWRRVARVGNMLRSLGVGPGDKVATAASNSLELLETYWAVPAIGATLVPLSPMLLPAGMASLLQGSDATCLITQSSMLPVLDAIRDQLPPQVLLIDRAVAGFGDYRALAAAQPEALEPAAVGADDLFNIMFTSGTTGLPKGIMHTHYVRSMYCTLMGAALRMTPESRTLHSGAIVFNGAFVTMMPTFHLGGTYILQRQFEPQQMLATIEREHVTHVMLVPAQVSALFAEPGFDPARLASLECILSLGAPLLLEDKDRLNRALPGRLYELYGLTEGFVTILDREDAVRKSGTVGVPPPFFGLRVVRDDGTDAAPREIGEIVGRGPLMMSGYYKRPDLTAQAARDGWIHSGDLGHLDEDGYLHLVDRKKDMIDSGGVKVYPRDIEEIVARHPDVLEVAVFGIPHDKWGETPLAAVILRKAATTTAVSLRDWINERVGARYQRVSEVVIMSDFPRSAAGKTLKRELREPYWEALCAERNIRRGCIRGGVGSLIGTVFEDGTRRRAVRHGGLHPGGRHRARQRRRTAGRRGRRAGGAYRRDRRRAACPRAEPGPDHVRAGHRGAGSDARRREERMTIFALGEDTPQIDDSAYVADGATVIGKVVLAKDARVWPHAVLRGDNGETIEVGIRSNIQDGAVLHTDPGLMLRIGEDVNVGHQAMLHGCSIGDGTLIGVQAVVLNGASIGRNCLVGAGAVVTERKVFPDNSLIVGAPAKVLRELSEGEIAGLRRNAVDYAERGRRYRVQLKKVG